MEIRMIYLAAGNSRRFGSNKLLYEINGKAMFAYGLEALFQVLEEMEETSLTVVTNYAEIEEYVQGRRRVIGKERIATVKSPDSHMGISYSIRAGIMGPDAGVCLSSDDRFAVQPGGSLPFPISAVKPSSDCFGRPRRAVLPEAVWSGMEKAGTRPSFQRNCSRSFLPCREIKEGKGF